MKRPQGAVINVGPPKREIWAVPLDASKTELCERQRWAEPFPINFDDATGEPKYLGVSFSKKGQIIAIYSLTERR